VRQVPDGGSGRRGTGPMHFETNSSCDFWTMPSTVSARFRDSRAGRLVMSDEQPHRFLIHDHDSIYSDGVDRTIAAMGLTILKTPARSPHGHAFCERVIGTIRRDCLDWMMPFNEGHLRRVLRHWVAHDKRGVHTRASGPVFRM
jgi:hypothetical protein